MNRLKKFIILPVVSGKKIFWAPKAETSVITYLAATGEMEPGESENLNWASLILKKRAYISVISD